MQVRTKAQLRKDNEELRKIIAEMEIRATNAWEDIYEIYDWATGRDRERAKKALDMLAGIRGVKRLLRERIENAIEDERRMGIEPLESKLGCLPSL